MTTSIVNKAASLSRIIKLIPGIYERLNRIETRLDSVANKVGAVDRPADERETMETLGQQGELGLALTPANVEAIREELIELIKVHPEQVARIDTVRRALALGRFNACADKLSRICEADPEKVHPGSLDYNLWELKKNNFVVIERPSRLLFPLLAIDRVYLNRANLRVLIIGPRTEMENIQYVSYGFDPRNIRSVDLFSYSDTIDVGDMHDLPYADGEFDIIVCGWVISYSDENKVAAKEMLRVCKPGGLLAVSLDYRSYIRYTEGDSRVEKQCESTDDVLELFGDLAGKVYFRNDPDPAYPVSKLREPSGNIIVFERK